MGSFGDIKDLPRIPIRSGNVGSIALVDVQVDFRHIYNYSAMDK